MSGQISLTLAFATGLLGAFHCLGMCSGIAGGLFARFGPGQRAWAVLGYHGARILVYTALGAGGAALGRVLVQTGWIGKAQGLLMMAAGVLIVLLGLDLLGLRRLLRRTPPPANPPQVRFGQAPAGTRPWWPPLAGALNGLVPCALVFSVAIKATATADPLRAGLLMAAFGLGTLPTMGLVSLAGRAIGQWAGGLLARLAALVVVALGLWTFYEGWVFYDIMRGLSNW